MKFYSCTLRNNTSKLEHNVVTFAVPADSFTEAIDKVDIFISGAQATDGGTYEVLRLSQISRTLKQSITDGASLSWHKE